jgi:septation ring formation regulator EzrA
MQQIAKTNEQTEKRVSEIKKDISKLVKLQESKHQNFEQLKKTVDKLQRDLKSLENDSENSDEEKDERRIKRKLSITKKEKSESFTKWIFNNNEK